MNNSIFTVKSLSLFGEGGYRILSEVTCLFSQGGNVILGHNGAGKTSLLHILAGFTKPSVGEVYLGSSYTNYEVAFVFQKPILLRRTVQQNIDFILSVRKNKSNIFIPSKLLERLDLDKKQHCHADMLSGGERQKLALIMALLLNPKILILDEPTANIDLKTESEVESLLFDLKQYHGVHIILTTHIISQAKRLSDNVVYMHEGRISEVTSGDLFFKHPVSEPARNYMNSFLGTEPCY